MRRWIAHPLRVAAGLIATAALLLGLGVWASQRALPGDALYSLKRAWESTQLAFTHGTDRGTTYLHYASRRVDEVSGLLSRASASGTGALADDGVDSHTITLIDSTLDSADSDVREGSRILTDQASTQRSATPLDVLIGWAPAQLSTLHSIEGRLPDGAHAKPGPGLDQRAHRFGCPSPRARAAGHLRLLRHTSVGCERTGPGGRVFGRHTQRAQVTRRIGQQRRSPRWHRSQRGTFWRHRAGQHRTGRDAPRPADVHHHRSATGPDPAGADQHRGTPDADDAVADVDAADGRAHRVEHPAAATAHHVARHLIARPPSQVRRDRGHPSGAHRYPGRVSEGRTVPAAIESAAAPRPPAVASPDSSAAAFFDVDNTMMVGASIFHFAQGHGRAQLLHLAGPAAVHRCGRPGCGCAARRTATCTSARESALAFVAGKQVAEIVALGEEIYDEEMAGPDLVGHPRARPSAPRRRAAGLAGHRDPGRAGDDHRPAARAHRRARHGRRDRRRHLHRPPGRRRAARRGQGAGGARAAAREGLDLRACTAYSDSINDLPMLSPVGHPVAVNPDSALRAEAKAHGWSDPRLPDRPQGRAGWYPRRTRGGDGGRCRRGRDGDPA